MQRERGSGTEAPSAQPLATFRPGRQRDLAVFRSSAAFRCLSAFVFVLVTVPSIACADGRVRPGFLPWCFS
jgi:hypothetical protein